MKAALHWLVERPARSAAVRLLRAARALNPLHAAGCAPACDEGHTHTWPCRLDDTAAERPASWLRAPLRRPTQTDEPAEYVTVRQPDGTWDVVHDPTGTTIVAGTDVHTALAEAFRRNLDLPVDWRTS